MWDRFQREVGNHSYSEVGQVEENKWVTLER